MQTQRRDIRLPNTILKTEKIKGMRGRQRIDKRSGKNYSKTIKLHGNGNKF